MTVPRRPFYRRKWWQAAGLLWLTFAYPLSLGPVNYAQGRGWISPAGNAVMQAVYEPLAYLAVHEIPPGELILAYADWWGGLAADTTSD